jgi:hypothetical protein
MRCQCGEPMFSGRPSEIHVHLARRGMESE